LSVLWLRSCCWPPVTPDWCPEFKPNIILVACDPGPVWNKLYIMILK
jgi:hypothetical protein